MNNNLKNMRTYLVGAMDRVIDGGVGWRNAITPMLSEMGVTVLNPCEKPIESAKEGPDTRTIIDYYKQTKLWLDKWRVPYVDIYMRPTDDTRSDKAVKSDFIKTFTEDKKEKIHFAVDDRLVICNLFRSKGIICLHARDGDDDYDSNKKD